MTAFMRSGRPLKALVGTPFFVCLFSNFSYLNFKYYSIVIFEIVRHKKFFVTASEMEQNRIFTRACLEFPPFSDGWQIILVMYHKSQWWHFRSQEPIFNSIYYCL